MSLGGVRDALAAAVDDPSLELLVATADGSAYTDGAGRARPAPDSGDGRRGVAMIQGPGARS